MATRFTRTVLFLAFTLVFAISASAQFINVNPTDNPGAYPITAVTSTATSATYAVTGNIFPTGVYVVISVSKVNGAAQPAGLSLNGNFLVTAASPTSITVQGASFPVWTSATAVGTATIINSDPVTYLPGKAYNGSTCNSCHSASSNPVTPPGTIASGPFDPNGWYLTGHAQVIRKVAPAGTYPGFAVANFNTLYNANKDWVTNLVDSQGGPINTTSSSAAFAGYNLNWTTGAVTGGVNNGPLTYIVGGWNTPDAQGGFVDAFWLTSWDLSTAVGAGSALSNGTIVAGSGTGVAEYNCVYCHTTGYRYDGLGPEPSVVTAPGTYVKLTDAQLPRLPAMSGGAPQAPTSSWGETGITCNRCHATHDCTGDSAKKFADGTVATLPAADPNTGYAQCAWLDSSFDVARPSPPYAPKGEQATKLCAECHRTPGAGEAGMVSLPGTFSGAGKCSDGTAANIQTCMNAGNFWVFKPSISHGSSGINSYLNSPHAMFVPACSINPATNTTLALCTAANGAWGAGQNTLNSVDQSVNFYGKYTSHFYDWGESLEEAETEWNSCYTNASQPVLPSYCNGKSLNSDSTAMPTDGPHDGGTYTINSKTVVAGTANAGCTGCHNVHYSTMNPETSNGWASMTTTDPIVGGPVPLAFAMPNGKQCIDCHSSNRYAPGPVAHSMGANTPFDAAKYPASNNGCAVCHMSLANAGLGAYHYFRINPDPTYFTFSAANAYGCTGTGTNVVCTGNGTAATSTLPTTYDDGSGYKDASGNTLATALDVDLACGQCHTGGNGQQNAYSIASKGAPVFTRAQLASYAKGIHNTVPTVALAPKFSLPSSTYPANSKTPLVLTITEAIAGASICYTTDGTVPVYVDAGLATYAESVQPSCSNGHLASSGVTLPAFTATTTVQAIAAGANSAGQPLTPSSVVVGTYTIQATAPVLKGGAFTVEQILPLTGVTGYCTAAAGTNCTTMTSPAPASLTISVPTTVRVVNAPAGELASAITTATFMITPSAPAFSAPSGAIAKGTSVIITGPAGSTIYYTTNGSVPTTSSASGPAAGTTVVVSASEYVRAIAVYTSGTQTATSSVATATYTAH